MANKKAPVGAPIKHIAPYEHKISPTLSFETEEFPKDINLTGGPGFGNRTDEFHVDYLKTQFRDIARPNYFKIKIDPPTVLAPEWNNRLTMLAKSAVFPSIEISNYEFERAGFVLHVPTNKMNYGDLTITFYNDVDFEIRTLFNRWQRMALFNWQKDIGSIPAIAMAGKVTVYQFDAGHNPVYAVEVDNAWPKNISEISLDQDSTDQLETFSVQFVFTNHEILKAWK